MKRYTEKQVIEMLRTKQAGRTQKELAEEIECSEAYLSDILNGRRDPSERILKYLGLNELTEYVKQE